MKKKILNIEGMTCSACSNGLEKYLNKQEGIKEASVNLVMAEAMINYDETKLNEQDLSRFVKEAGFKSLGEIRNDGNSKNELKLIVFFAVLCILLMTISMGIKDFKQIQPKLYTTIMLVSAILGMVWGFDIIKNGVKNILHKMPNMDSLVGIGVVVNFLYSLYNAILIYQENGNVTNLYFESSIMIILFVKIGRYIDKKNRAKAIETIKNLVTITPKNGTIIREGKEHNVTINEIQKGDIVICKPGEKIAVDGIVTKGQTYTDESFLTGESKPVSKDVGSNVMAGSINYNGYIEYEAINIGKDSSISHIVDLVVEATNTKAPIERIADKISGYFVPFIFIVAVISFILNFAITKDISAAVTALVTVLVVACPCALGLATPLAMVIAIGNGSKKGIVIKSSESFEAINKIDKIIFDKTGTITKGKLSITDQKYINTNKGELLKLLQSLESRSNHPLAKSICNNITELYNVEDFEEIAGKGVKGKIKDKLYFAGNKKLFEGYENIFKTQEIEYSKKGESIVYFGDEKQILAVFGLGDEIKEDAKETISELKRMGKKVIMLSGDNEITAKAIAKEMEIDEVYTDCSPEEKLEKIMILKDCAMVGDGINDSPALKKATIGISVANGTDISSDSSDIILMVNNMNRIVYLFELGKKTLKIIKENLFWAMFYNICMIPLATGLLPIKLTPMIASIAMTFSSLTVVLNSLRLSKEL